MPFYKSPPAANPAPRQQPNPRNNMQYYSQSTTTTTISPPSAVQLPQNTVSFFTTAATEVKLPRRQQQVDHCPSKFFGVVGDCRIDTRASTYISAVQERFKLERLDPDRVVIIDQAS
ncbi:unnamed protein product [Linum tenue]|uniref:Uncharacterized protein n=1 Tax=Linum tenue TaxID=586396 RepID=A0AAV0NGD0_9ROSI|nr:unnamed protein product [Linum tenue]